MTAMLCDVRQVLEAKSAAHELPLGRPDECCHGRVSATVLVPFETDPRLWSRWRCGDAPGGRAVAGLTAREPS